MGRHRRTAPPPVGAPPAETATGRHRGDRPARALRAAPVRTGLLGASAALAMGAVAVASGLLPGGGTYELGQDDTAGPQVRAGALPDPSTQGAESASPTADRGATPATRGGERPDAPQQRPSSSASPSDRSTEPAGGSSTTPGQGSGSGGSGSGAAPTSPAPARTTASAAAGTSDAESSAGARVLSLVNEERDKAGCAPVTADSELAELAQTFSEDMARRDFFDHTDPDGDTPWDRAKSAGITDLGGENIARGQSTPEAVMDSWMNSPGHRANILNCDYRTLGVGTHMAPGGPWWTQDFGF